MADLLCDLCNAEGAVAMFTNLTDGQVTTIGASCMPGFALGLAAELAEAIPADQRDAYADLAGTVARALLPTIPLADGGKGSVSGRPKRRRAVHVDQGEQGISLPPDSPPAAAQASQTRTLAEWQAGQSGDPRGPHCAAAGCGGQDCDCRAPCGHDMCQMNDPPEDHSQAAADADGAMAEYLANEASP